MNNSQQTPSSNMSQKIKSQLRPTQNMGIYQPAETPMNMPQMQMPVPENSRALTPSTPRTIMNGMQQVPETLTNQAFLPAYLNEHIGQWMRVEFLIGTSMTDRVGILTEVGASYIVLQALDPNSVIVCDLFSIKFVTIIGNNRFESLINR